VDLRQFFFKFRGLTPVPIVLLVLVFARPTASSFFWGIFFMFIGEMIRFWGVAYAGGATRTRNVGANMLVTNGPFAYVRNPLYIGNMFIYSGAAIISNTCLPWLILFIWIFFGIQYHLIVKLEEEKLQELFGNSYLEYKNKVPRFLPQLHPFKAETPVRPDFKNALKSEKSTFFSMLVILLLMSGKMLLNSR
jgi:protein-S-isoprenylcysteine O-methyltransferase Ste14